MRVSCKIDLQGIVQGVGLRPWVARQARQLDLAGCVRNTAGGLSILIEGSGEQVEQFKSTLRHSPPEGAAIEHVACQLVTPTNQAGFVIETSLAHGRVSACVPKDRAMCGACLAEQRDPANRRYRHPFISCVTCGPRFTIAAALPFDRSRTSMAEFPLCPACRAEYDNPDNRRHHAQTIACNDCGPRLTLHTRTTNLAGDDVSLRRALEILHSGGILALKGVGGYQLVCDAQNDSAISKLRNWKGRQRKPLAVMLPDSNQAVSLAHLSTAEHTLLTSPAAPIVILKLRKDTTVSGLLAPALNSLGVMLPASPLHQLLADDFVGGLVVTSGNRKSEPILLDDNDACATLMAVADAVLMHDREIVHCADDSLVRLAGENAILMRHARGYAPSSFPLSLRTTPGTALGGHMKGAAALCHDNRLTLLQHIGDLGSIASQTRLHTETRNISQHLFRTNAQWVAHDTHPDYASTELARASHLPTYAVPHHVAHVLSLVAEQQIPLPVIGVAFDGTGLGMDGRIWGGEFIVLDHRRNQHADSTAQYFWRHVGTLLDFPLPGGEAAVREPRRAALGMAWRMADGNETKIPGIIRALFTAAEWRTLTGMLTNHINCPRTTSMGRLFDAIAACLGCGAISEYDGEAAMGLEALVRSNDTPPVFSCSTTGGIWDWRPLIHNLLRRLAAGVDRPHIAADFHAAISDMIRQMVTPMASSRVLLTGGVFQNACLLQGTCTQLTSAGKQPYIHRNVPPNDGALALGQALGAAAKLNYDHETAPCA